MHIAKGVLTHGVDPHHGRTPWVYATKIFLCLVVKDLHVTLPCIPTCVKTEMQLLAWYLLPASQTTLHVLYPSQGTTLSRSPVPSCKQARLIRDPPRSLVERREVPQEGSKVVRCAQRAAYPLHRVACGEQRSCQRTRCASPLQCLQCAQTVQAHASEDICSAPSSGAGRPTQEPAVVVHGTGPGGLTQKPAVVVHEAGAGRPSLVVDNSYAVYQRGGGAIQLWFCLPRPHP